MNREKLVIGFQPAPAVVTASRVVTSWWVRVLIALLAVAALIASWTGNTAANGIGSIFVANHGNNSVTILEQVDHKELITLPAPAPSPRAGAPVPTPSPEQLAIGEGPIAVAFSQDGCFGYVASEGSGSIIGIDRNVYQITRAYPKISARIRGFASTHPDEQTDWLLIGDLPKNQMLVVDAVDGQVVRVIPLPGRPVAVTANRDGTRVYALTEEADFVSVLDPTAGFNLLTREVDPGVSVELPEIVVGPEAASLLLSPRGDTLFVADPTINRISVVDTSSRTVLHALPSGAYPAGMAVTPDGRLLLVANRDENSVTIFDALRPDTGRSVPVGGRPNDVAVHPSGRFGYVVNSADNTVMVLDLPPTIRDDGSPLVNVNLEMFSVSQDFLDPVAVRERPVAIGVAPVCGPPETRPRVPVQVADVVRVPIVVTVTEELRVQQTVVATVVATVVVPAPTPTPTVTFPRLPATGDGPSSSPQNGPSGNSMFLLLGGVGALALAIPLVRRLRRAR
ncbi:MAG: hypothetical protein CL878_04685 [Dehalococcoidia bacterium]|nr:hypothetical protein [Dehalococcoidia bacterium]